MPRKRGDTFHADFRLPSGKRVRCSLRTGDQKEATRLELQLMADMIRPKASPKMVAQPGSPTLTLETAFRKALRTREKWRSSTARRTIEENFEHVAKELGKDTPLAAITDETMLAFSEKMTAAKLSPSTINQRLSLVSTVFKEAKLWPGCESLRLPYIVRQAPRRGRIRVVSPEEEAKVIRLLSESGRQWHADVADLVAVLVDTGCRLSEALRMATREAGLAAKMPRGFTEIHLESKSITVWDAKANNPSAVPLSERAYAILERRGEMPFKGLTVDAADNAWEWVRGELGLKHDKEFVIHALRHTTASRLVSKGNDTARVQRFMRHKNVATTMKYVHLDVEALRGMV